MAAVKKNRAAVKAKPKANAKPRATKPVVKRAKSPAKAKTKANAKTKAKTIAPPASLSRSGAAKPRAPAIAKPLVKPALAAGGAPTPLRGRASRSSPVVEILDDPHPISALRAYLARVRGRATKQQAEIALGSAQLLLLPIARESRGGLEVTQLLDLVLERWSDFGDRRFGFHAQEFLRNAFASVGGDRERIARLQAAVPEDASGELLFEIACAYAGAGDEVAMMRAVEAALAAGATPAQFRRESEFAPYVTEPGLAVMLARADIPNIPVNVDPHRGPVRAALDSLLVVLEGLGGQVELRPPARLDTILDAERAAKLSLPNDYRAFLSITNGMRVLDREFLATSDYREPTSLAQRAHHFVHAEYAAGGLSDCVPLASLGQPEDWLLYDPRGRVRGGAPGYLATNGKNEIILDDLVAALGWLEALTRDILETN